MFPNAGSSVHEDAVRRRPDDLMMEPVEIPALTAKRLG